MRSPSSLSNPGFRRLLLRASTGSLLLAVPLLAALPVSRTAAAPPIPFVSVAAGSQHTCAISTAKTVLCWGENSFGQLGNSTKASSARPVSVTTLQNVAALALGESHSCALDTSGAVWCWGRNRYGETGVNRLRDKSSVLAPKQVPFPKTAKPIKQISAGSKHTCAIDTAGTAFCWGYNAFGQLGTGRTKDAYAPIAVYKLPAASQIATGSMHTCAIVSAALQCWGRLGGGSSFAAPQKISGLTGSVSALALGVEHTCVLISSSVFCAGRTNLTQTGQPTSSTTTTTTTTTTTNPAKTTTTSSPSLYAASPSVVSSWQKVATLPPVSALVSRNDTTCALSSGALWCWGSTRENQILAQPLLSTPPTKLTLPGPVSQASVGSQHVCATIGSDVYCWGDGLSGQLGHGRLVRASAPVRPEAS